MHRCEARDTNPDVHCGISCLIPSRGDAAVDTYLEFVISFVGAATQGPEIQYKISKLGSPPEGPHVRLFIGVFISTRRALT